MERLVKELQVAETEQKAGSRERDFDQQKRKTICQLALAMNVISKLIQPSAQTQGSSVLF
jgi:hypothetical protein